MNREYYSSGQTIKSIAVLYVAIVSVVSVILGVLLILDESKILGWVVIIGGIISAVASELLLYAFGELVESCTCTAFYSKQIAKMVIEHKKEENAS